MLDKLENTTVGMISPEAFEASLLVSGNTARWMHDHTVPLSVFCFSDVTSWVQYGGRAYLLLYLVHSTISTLFREDKSTRGVEQIHFGEPRKLGRAGATVIRRKIPFRV